MFVIKENSCSIFFHRLQKRIKLKSSEKSFRKLSQPLEVALILKIWTVEKLSAYFRNFSQLLFSLLSWRPRIRRQRFFFVLHDYELFPRHISMSATSFILPVLRRSFHVPLVERRGSWIPEIERLG